MSLISSQNLTRLRIRALFLTIATLFSAWLMGQDDLNIHGVISDAMTSSKLGDVTVKVLKDGSSHDSYTTRANGKYEFYLDIGSHYELKFQKEGFVERSIVIDSRNVPMEIVGAGIIMPTDMSMYEITPAMEGEDLSVFEEPIGKASYNPTEEDLSWDFQYTNQVKGEIFALMRAVEKKQKEMDKAASDEQKALDELEAKFAQFVKDGDASMDKKNYEDAVLNYQAALDLKPDDVSVQSKLGDAETKLNAQRAEEELSANYNAALDAGDGFMRTEEFDKAIEQYEVALSLRPNEEYPQTQINKANQIKEERAASLAKQEQFNEIMSRAETEMADQKWAEAVESYKEALLVIPDNREAQRKLGEAEQALQNAEALAEKQAQYEDLIAKADLSFGSKDYPTAEGFYRQAQQVLPDETYPQEQIDKCLQFINQAEQAEALQAEFDALVQKGDDAAVQTKYALAIESYQGALNLIPDDEVVKTKLKDAQGLLAEKEAAEKKQEDYTALISEADELFKETAYAEAKVKYQLAKDLIPEETYPLDQITKIDQLLKDQAAQAEAEATYTAAMEAGKSALSSQSYSEAVGQFELALSAKPEDKEATKALNEAKELLAEFEANNAIEEQYSSLISSADEKMANEKLNEAILDYRAALEVKPKEDYPKSQIELIEQMIAEQEAEAAENERLAQIEAQYTEFMSAGQAKLAAKDYEGAIEQFNFALEVKPNDETAISKKEEAESMLSQAELLAQKQKEYDDLILQADDLFAAKKWEDAISKYDSASQVKPEEDYPQNQINLIREEVALAEQAELDKQEAEKAEQVRQLVLEGDRLVSELSYVDGVDKYEEALGIAPDRKDIQKKIDEATQAYLAYQEASALQEAYDAEIAEADKQFGSENWERAKASYANALEIKPEETYPADQIKIIDERIAALAEAADLERRQQIQAQFDDFIADGDKQFEKNKYERALESYQNALDLIPDSELALEKIAEVNQALGAISEAEDNRRRYESLVDEADEYFDSEDYEMARLKYLDAGEILPEENYPPKKISEIDIILEKQRLKDEEAALAELEAEYRNILSQADQSMASLQYDQAITQYQSALDLKPEEVYPKSQIERIQLLIKDEEEARLRRERRRELEREAALKRQNRSKNQVVNTDSEEQAEQFMREARAAQEKERYERIKKMKEDHQSKQSSLNEYSASTSKSNYDDLSRYRATNVQFAAAAQTKDKERQKAVNSKEALESSETLRTEMERAQREVAYDQVEQTKEDHSAMISDMENIHAAKVRNERDKNKEKLEQIESWSEESKNRKLENSERIQTNAEEVYTSNQQADAKREERAKELKANEEAYKEYQRELSEKNFEDIRERAETNQEEQEAFQADLQSRNEQKVSASQKLVEQEKEAYYSNLDDKSRMADEKRQRSAEELSNVRSNEPKSYDEYFRTQLAENYPQGVTEESSTLGNKVIITRIVVKGNKGDEYKKVLDKAGNYYFKNGQSISEYTWRRETIDAFNKSKD